MKFSSAHWLRDGRGVLYSRFATPSNHNQTGYDVEKLHYNALYYHKMGTTQDEDVLLYKIDKYPYHTLSGHLSTDAKTLYIDMDEGDRAIYGFVDVSKLGDDWMEKPLPEPTWLTSLDFTEEFMVVTTEEKSALAKTSIGTKSGYDMRLVRIDLDNPERENWVEVAGEDTFLKNARVERTMVANGKFVVKYYLDGYHQLYVYTNLDGKKGPMKLDKIIETPFMCGISEEKYEPDQKEMFFEITSYNTPGKT